ncbi:MAG: hypothetical protein WAK71_02845 [Streptosporangiaceae bacterium]|jgi:hypothetical protein
MPDADIMDLMRASALSFTGVISQLHASTVAELAVDDRTAIVAVDQVLHAPSAFRNLSGSDVTLQLSENAAIPAAGERFAFFANPLIFARTLGLAEVGRRPASEVDPHIASAAAVRAPTPLSGFADQLETERLLEHAASADAVVVGQVLGLAKAGPFGHTEHDPDWWRATIEVSQVEKGNVQPGPLAVLYPNSQDTRWYDKPKPHAGQRGMWLLHATADNLRELAPFELADADDYQQVQQLDRLRRAPE